MVTKYIPFGKIGRLAKENEHTRLNYALTLGILLAIR